MLQFKTVTMVCNHIKDQGIVQMKLKQLLQHKSKSPEVDKGNESNHDKNETI